MAAPADETAVAQRGWVARVKAVGDRVRHLMPVLRVIGYVAAVGIVVVMGVRAADDVHVSQLTWWPLAVAVVAAAAWWLLLARGWALLVTGHFRASDVSTWCRTQTLRYLPGGVWAPASRATVLHGKLLDRLSTVAAENVIALCAALAIGGVALGVSKAWWWLPLIAVVALPALGSRFVEQHTRLAPPRVHRATLNYLAAFAGYVTAAVLVQAAVSGWHHSFTVAGAAAIAWGAGLVVVIAPSGVGVRELVYVGLMSHALPSGELTAGAVTLRIVTIVAELSVLLVGGRPREGEATVPELLRPALAGAATSTVAFVRRHAVFLGLLAAGIGLRVVTWLAYQPALIYWDSVDYLNRAANLSPGQARPLAYSVFIRILPGDHLTMVSAAQHGLGLLMAVGIYVVLLRYGVRRWVAALATAPVLLDAYQLVMEEYILSETLFEFLILLGCLALLWRRKKPGAVQAAIGAGVAGLAFAGAALTRANGLVVIAPAVLIAFCLWFDTSKLKLPRTGPLGSRVLSTAGGGARALVPAVAVCAVLVAGFVVPLDRYAHWFKSIYGEYAITDQGGRFLYARVAPFADCRKFSVPKDERILCPHQPVGHRPKLYGSSVNWYMWARWGKDKTPALLIPRKQRRHVTTRFAKRVIVHQPGDYFQAVAHDFLRGFAPLRQRGKDELPISRWQFQVDYPIFSDLTGGIVKQHHDGVPHANTSLSSFLRDYQRFGFIPGPLLALGLIAGLLAFLGVPRARGSGMRCAAFLFAAMGFLVLFSSVATNQFTWRYQVALVVFLPAAAALGLSALIRRRPAPQTEDERGEIQASAAATSDGRQPAQPEAVGLAEPGSG